jgi:hypothetical protein
VSQGHEAVVGRSCEDSAVKCEELLCYRYSNRESVIISWSYDL